MPRIGLNLSSEATLVLLLLPWTRPRFPATLRKKLSLPGAMAERIEEELRCPTCLNIFKDPVMLKCSHSFCRACVKQWWKHKQARSCPVCRKSSLPVDVSPNLTLKNVCETFTKVSVETETMCSLHGEKKKLFCLDHQQCVCLICRDAQIHSGHKFCSLDEIVQEHREKFQKSLQKVKENLAEFTEIQNNCSEQAEYIKVQKDLVESKIKKNFEELRQFLEVEEQAKLAALREEEQKKSHMMKEKMEALNRDMATLSDIISSTEKWVASDHVSFMNNYQVAMTTVQQLPDKPVLPPGALLDEVKHLGNLKFTVWFRMKETVSYSPVILDPNTASPHFNLSEDLTSVNFNGEKRCPMNPERCQYWNRVLGCALDPGTHIWDVEVGDNRDWLVGVVGGDSRLPHSSFVWGIKFNDDKYQILSLPYPAKNLRVKVKVQRVRVRVDTDTRSLSFSESHTNTELYTRNHIPNWPNLSGNATMYPYFYTNNDKGPLKIIPLTFCVMTQNPK
ncbi:E3 ubiquitin-protein ligase TRIM35-like isoform X2 [Syngnathoides biaculeatus]|uniref:E3 ubiquitin-protein ligase TRIM35-like isoform X2 n=1 Tax=Syngnathoides biaculeatus TaxID=300417 RepID=UPI002ADE3D81|nr:E3 ubiquitin-protein ligase TRIM35-like isoform X2 [Syngnathoides biaculeatus]